MPTCRHENKYVNELLIDCRTHYNLIVVFSFNIFCIYKKLFEKIDITSEGLYEHNFTLNHVKKCFIV